MDELDLEKIEENLKQVNAFPRGIGGVVDELFDNQEKLIAEVKRLRQLVRDMESAMKEMDYYHD